MKSRICVLAAISAFAALAACSGADDAGSPESESIDTQPATLDQATQTLSHIHQLQQLDPNDARAAEALQRLQPVLDRLNHLIARVEVGPDHVVNFYEPTPGHIGVSERGSTSAPRYLDALEYRNLSAAELYRALTGKEAPETLRTAAALDEASESHVAAALEDGAEASSRTELEATEPSTSASGDVATTAQALTGADGPWWAANVCFKSGDFRSCNPNWANGGFAYANTKTSFLSVAPYAGDWLQVRMQYRDSTKFTDVVYPGQWLSWWYHSGYADCGFLEPTCPLDYNRNKHRWDILQASGDSFHWTYSFKWTCGDARSCDAWPAQ